MAPTFTRPRLNTVTHGAVLDFETLYPDGDLAPVRVRPAPGHAAARVDGERPAHRRRPRTPARTPATRRSCRPARATGSRASRARPRRDRRLQDPLEPQRARDHRGTSRRLRRSSDQPSAAADVQVVAGLSVASSERAVSCASSAGAASREQDRQVRRVQRVRAAAVALARARGDQQVGVALEQVEVALAERAQALGGGNARAQRRRAGDQLVLERRACARPAAPGRARRGRRSGGRACRCRRRRGRRRPPSRRARSRARRRAPPPPRGCAGGCGRRRRARAAGAPSAKREVEHVGDHADCSTGARTSLRQLARGGRPGGRSARGRRARRPRRTRRRPCRPAARTRARARREALSTLRTSACAQTAPNRPVLAPMTADGLSWSTLSGNGRDAQSSAFFSPPGTDALYSGVAIRSASAASISSQERPAPLAGGSFSRSSSKMGRPPRPSHSTSSTPGGSASPAARSSLRLWEPRRRLPAMPRIRMALRLLDERELDGQRDLVGERVAAGGQRRRSSSCRTRCGRRRPRG